MTTACSNDEVYTDGSLGEELDSSNSKTVTFSQADMDGVSVLIFAHSNTEFKYLRHINTGWTEDGKVSTLLDIGTYKFLFLKKIGINTILYPNPLDANSNFEDIKIEAKEDILHEGYLLPVDEIWLPETEEMAKEIYVINNPTTIYNKLKRAVSQIKLNIKRGYKSESGILPYPFPEGKNIMDNIKEIKMDISGIGETVTISGGSGSSKTQYTSQVATEITTEGYAVFDGPFVFPNGTGMNASVKITITPKDESAFPVMTVDVEGLLERNKKMEITLWLTSIYKFINVTVVTDPISESQDGDLGIWE